MTEYTHAKLDGVFGRRAFSLELAVNSEIDLVSFPATWWDQATPQQISAIGFVEYTPPAPSIEDLRTAKLAALAERRWQAETGGTTVAGTPIKTDAQSTGKITAAYVQATANPSFTARWKVDTGIFVTLDAATIMAIGDAVTAHVQACFDREDTLTTAILAAEDISALAAIDIGAGWPQ